MGLLNQIEDYDGIEAEAAIDDAYTEAQYIVCTSELEEAIEKIESLLYAINEGNPSKTDLDRTLDGVAHLGSIAAEIETVNPAYVVGSKYDNQISFLKDLNEQCEGIEELGKDLLARSVAPASNHYFEEIEDVHNFDRKSLVKYLQEAEVEEEVGIM